MLAQTTFFVTLMTAIVLGVLTTNLISAGVARDHEIAKYTTIASDDAVDNFVSLMQAYVKEHGTEGPWPTAIPPSAPIALCPDGSCPYTYTIEAKITGASTAKKQNQTDDEALNLQKLILLEERLSISVTTQLETGSEVLSTNSRLLTVRIFNGTPYAMVAGQHDIISTNGASADPEGDTGGISDYRYGQTISQVPNAQNPDAYRNTEIRAEISCTTVDNIQNQDSSKPSHNQGRGNRGLPWGVGLIGGFELPCTSTFASPSPGNFSNEDWLNGNSGGHYRQ